MGTTDTDTIREWVTEQNWNVLTSKTGEKVPPCLDGGWHRKIVLDDGEYRREVTVSADQYDELRETDWFC